MSDTLTKSPAASIAGTPAGNGGSALHLYLGDTRQLFNSMDPAPFRERDLDPKAVDYIVDWARDTSKAQALNLVVHLGRESANADDAVMLSGAVHEYFGRRAVATRKQLRQLFRTGRISLLIGILFMGVMMLVGELAGTLFSRVAYATLLKESLIISGWVALWRPAEIFLHEWWPILGEARLFDRLASMNVSLFSDVGARSLVAGPVAS